MARGNSVTLCGNPLCGLFKPAMRVYIAPREAPSECFETTGLMSWVPVPVVKERTIDSLSARCASPGNDPPNVTPGMHVCNSSVALRIPAGAAVQKQKNDGSIGDSRVGGCYRSRAQPFSQGKPRTTERTDLDQSLPSTPALSENRYHAAFPRAPNGHQLTMQSE